jgi:hypothetical protein
MTGRGSSFSHNRKDEKPIQPSADSGISGILCNPCGVSERENSKARPQQRHARMDAIICGARGSGNQSLGEYNMAQHQSSDGFDNSRYIRGGGGSGL